MLFERVRKSFTDEQKETFEKFYDCRSEYMSLAEQEIFTKTMIREKRKIP